MEKIKFKEEYYDNEYNSISLPNKKLKYKKDMFNKLSKSFMLEKPYYLVINNFDFSNIKTFLELYKIRDKKVKYFNDNFNRLRFLRNSLSHGDNIQLHLNRLKKDDYKKTIENIKKLNRYNLNTDLRIKYNLLNISYAD